MLDVHTREHGYREIYIPYLVSSETLRGHRSAPEVRRRSVPHRRPRPLPDPDRRSPGDQRCARSDPRAATNCRCGSHATRPASGARRGRMARTRGGCCASTSSRRWSSCTSSARTNPARRWRPSRHTRRRYSRRLGLAYRGRHPVHRRHRFRRRQDVRHRGLAAGAAALPRDFILQQLRSLPGATHEARGGATPRPGRPSTCTPSTARGSPSGAP